MSLCARDVRETIGSISLCQGPSETVTFTPLLAADAMLVNPVVLVIVSLDIHCTCVLRTRQLEIRKMTSHRACIHDVFVHLRAQRFRVYTAYVSSFRTFAVYKDIHVHIVRALQNSPERHRNAFADSFSGLGKRKSFETNLKIDCNRSREMFIAIIRAYDNNMKTITKSCDNIDERFI